ncbi:hypothetical protein AAMO2058_001640500 [Amorphochlora amoebiformis]
MSGHQAYTPISPPVESFQGPREAEDKKSFESKDLFGEASQKGGGSVPASDVTSPTTREMGLGTVGGEASVDRRLARTLSVWDGLGVTVGIMVGSGIFASPAEVIDSAGGTYAALLAWVASGFLVLLGALCYAELGATFPNAGGDTWYLTLAYGDWAGFAFTWTSFLVLKTGSQAIILFVGSSYIVGGASAAGGKEAGWAVTLVAVTAIWLLTGINCLGVRMGSIVQNSLSLVKMGILCIIIICGLAYAISSPGSKARVNFSRKLYSEDTTCVGFLLAMVDCLWAFDGWADVAYLAEEFTNPRTALPRVVCASIAITLTLFLLVNISYMMVLDASNMAKSKAVAMNFASVIGGRQLAGFIAFAVAVSALGSANGSILTGGRVFYASARDGRFPPFMAELSSRRAPYIALISQGVISTVLVCLPGASFSKLLHYFAPASWLFYAATGSTVIVLRQIEPDLPRPFKCPLYPIPPIAVVIVGVTLVTLSYQDICI